MNHKESGHRTTNASGKFRCLGICPDMLMVLSALSTNLVHAESDPSFNCHRAASPVEHAICYDAAIAQIDRQLAAEWKALLGEFIDGHQAAEIREDQKQWLVYRNKCSDDVACLKAVYDKRLRRLRGADPAVPAAGIFGVEEIGGFALYPIGTGYLVYIQTADPKAGAWTCEIIGHASSEGQLIRVVVDGLHFSARLVNDHTLVVEPNNEVYAVEHSQCGWNGSISYSYTRARQ